MKCGNKQKWKKFPPTHSLCQPNGISFIIRTNLIKFYCSESDRVLDFPTQNIFTAGIFFSLFISVVCLFVTRNLRHGFCIRFCCGARTGWTLCCFGHRFNRFFHIMCILEIMIWSLMWTRWCRFDRLHTQIKNWINEIKNFESAHTHARNKTKIKTQIPMQNINKFIYLFHTSIKVCMCLWLCVYSVQSACPLSKIVCD